MAVVQPSEQPQVTAVVWPPATCPSSVLDVSARRVSVENVSFLPACFFMPRVYAPCRLPFVVNVTAPVILTLGRPREPPQARGHVRDRGGQQAVAAPVARDSVIGSPIRGRAVLANPCRASSIRVQPQVMAVVQRSVGLQMTAVVVQPHVTAVVTAPPATSPRSSSDVSARRVSVENVSFLPACFFMARVYASRRLPFVVNVTARLIFTLGRLRETAQASPGTSVIAEAGQRSQRRGSRLRDRQSGPRSGRADYCLPSRIRRTSGIGSAPWEMNASWNCLSVAFLSRM